jgi:anti-anti-sigma factor
MDSSGLGLLMGRITLAEALSCRVKITNADLRVKRLLNLAGLKRINNLVIEDSGKGENIS